MTGVQTCALPISWLFRVAPQTLKSQGKNTPFLGYELFGRVRYTLVAGNLVYEA